MGEIRSVSVMPRYLARTIDGLTNTKKGKPQDAKFNPKKG